MQVCWRELYWTREMESHTSVLSTFFIAGLLTGVVLDSGDGVTHICPVYILYCRSADGSCTGLGRWSHTHLSCLHSLLQVCWRELYWTREMESHTSVLSIKVSHFYANKYHYSHAVVIRITLYYMHTRHCWARHHQLSHQGSLQLCISNLSILPPWHARPMPERGRHTSTVRNVKMALLEKIVLLLHPHVDVPYSLVVT